MSHTTRTPTYLDGIKASDLQLIQGRNTIKHLPELCHSGNGVYVTLQIYSGQHFQKTPDEEKQAANNYLLKRIHAGLMFMDIMEEHGCMTPEAIANFKLPQSY